MSRPSPAAIFSEQSKLLLDSSPGLKAKGTGLLSKHTAHLDLHFTWWGANFYMKNFKALTKLQQKNNVMTLNF